MLYLNTSVNTRTWTKNPANVGQPFLSDILTTLPTIEFTTLYAYGLNNANTITTVYNVNLHLSELDGIF